MAGIYYLWSNRAIFSIFSIEYYKAWAKRFLCLPELIKRSRRRLKLIKKGAVIENTAEIGEVNIQGKKNNLKVGNNTFLGRVTIALHEKVIIGNNVCINDGVQILTASHDITDSEWKHIKKAIVIDDYAWIATNAIILPGVHIGKGAVVGAGAVVSKSIPDYAIVAGNPGKEISKKRCQNFNYNPCEFLATNMAWLIG